MNDLEAFFPGFEFFTNSTSSTQPYVKVTAQVNPNHQVSGTYQNDRLFATGDREYHYTPNSTIYSTGGLALFRQGELGLGFGPDLSNHLRLQQQRELRRLDLRGP